MKPKINLHEGEKMLIECQPQKALALYLFFTTGFALIIPVVLVGLFFIVKSASQVGLLNSQYNRSNLSANITVLDGLIPELADKITDLISQNMSKAR